MKALHCAGTATLIGRKPDSCCPSSQEAIGCVHRHWRSEGIISWIKKKTGPFATTVESADEMKGLEADNQVLIMAYYKAFEGAAYDTFKSVATKAEGVTFVQTTSADAAKVAGLTAEGVASIKVCVHV